LSCLLGFGHEFPNNKHGGREKLISLPPLTLCEYYLCIYNFCCLIADIVHPTNPFHLVFGFEFFGYTFLFGKLFYQPKKHILSLFVDICKVPVQFAFCEQGYIKPFSVRLNKLQMPLSPNADFDLFFSR